MALVPFLTTADATDATPMPVHGETVQRAVDPRAPRGFFEAWEWLTAQVRDRPKRDVRFWLEVGTTESTGAMRGRAPSILAANRAFRDALRAAQYDLTYVEVPNGVHAPETWRPRLPVGLEALAKPRKP